MVLLFLWQLYAPLLCLFFFISFSVSHCFLIEDRRERSKLIKLRILLKVTLYYLGVTALLQNRCKPLRRGIVVISLILHHRVLSLPIIINNSRGTAQLSFRDSLRKIQKSQRRMLTIWYTCQIIQNSSECQCICIYIGKGVILFD